MARKMTETARSLYAERRQEVLRLIRTLEVEMGEHLRAGEAARGLEQSGREPARWPFPWGLG